MSKTKLRLVHSVELSEKSRISRDEWGFENARQLSLFDDIVEIEIYTIAIDKYKYKQFERLLQKVNPRYLLDIRCYPNFQPIYDSFNDAVAQFDARGIIYDRTPLDFNLRSDIDYRWEVRRNIFEKFHRAKSCSFNGKSSFILIAQSDQARKTTLELLKPSSQSDSDWRFVDY